MALLVLPAGESLRTVAERLGVSVETLREHTGVDDVEAALPTERRVEVPDGFLRAPRAQPQVKDAVADQSGRMGGMNPFLALDIEQKRTRASGGMRAHVATDSELEALKEARRAYLRFEAESNDLAIDLYGQITATHSIDVRASAFAGQGWGYAQRCRLFGETLERSRPHALSAAKAALLADPKLADAHLALALALGAVNERPALAEAQAELETAVEQDPKAAWCWAELASVLERLGQLEDAQAAVGVALELEPDWLFALETAASLALKRDETERGLKLLDAAAATVPTCANVAMHLAMALKGLGKAGDATEARDRALALATRDAHRLSLQELFDKGAFPTAR